MTYGCTKLFIEFDSNYIYDSCIPEDQINLIMEVVRIHDRYDSVDGWWINKEWVRQEWEEEWIDGT